MGSGRLGWKSPTHPEHRPSSFGTRRTGKRRTGGQKAADRRTKGGGQKAPDKSADRRTGSSLAFPLPNRRRSRPERSEGAGDRGLGLWHGPPNAEDDPQPVSSISTTSTFGAPGGGRIGWIGGYFVSGFFASKVVGAIGRLAVGDRQYFALERVSYWHLRAYGSPCSVVVRAFTGEVWGRGVLYRLAQGGHSGL